MEITVDILKEKFEEYNEKYFDNKLQTPRFKLLKSYSKFGLFQYRKAGVRKIGDMTLSISKYIDWEENDLRDVIVHEMVHQYIAPKLENGEDEHGAKFQKKCNELNKKYGLNVTVKIDGGNFKKTKNAPKLGWFLMRLCYIGQKDN